MVKTFNPHNLWFQYINSTFDPCVTAACPLKFKVMAVIIWQQANVQRSVMPELTQIIIKEVHIFIEEFVWTKLPAKIRQTANNRAVCHR